jgi:hypothetical protein
VDSNDLHNHHVVAFFVLDQEMETRPRVIEDGSKMEEAGCVVY